MKTRLVTIITLVLLSLPQGLRAAEHPAIRVAIVKDVPSATVSVARGVLMVRPKEGETTQMRSAALRAVGSTLRVNGTPVPGDSVTIDGQPALYDIEGAKFRGVIKAYVAAPDKLLVVNELDLEDYLAGLINSEISSDWPLEAVKAQAIAARTYALNQIGGTTRNTPGARYDVEATVLDQVYHGAGAEDQRAYEGVRATTGMVLTKNGVIFPSFYHSACGGFTENARNVWSNMDPTQSVVDKYCVNSPHGQWALRIPRDRFLWTLTQAGIIAPDRLLVGIDTTPFPDSPRVNEIIFKTDAKPIVIKATELRRLLGFTRLKSTWFNVGMEGNDVVFAGRGFGHGVGLCQWGSKAMAEAGREYKEILKHYYKEAEIGRLY